MIALMALISENSMICAFALAGLLALFLFMADREKKNP